jgi:hypothetical protein
MVVSVADVHPRPVPVTAIWDWRLHAASRDIDTAVFFHPEHGRGPARDWPRAFATGARARVRPLRGGRGSPAGWRQEFMRTAAPQSRS